MLSWYPEKRATAEEMLSHPWLNMPDNDHAYMTDREHRNMMLRKQLDPKSALGYDPNDPFIQEQQDNMSELADSDYERFDGDMEDNDTMNYLLSDDGKAKPGDESDDLWDEQEERQAKEIARGRTIKRKPKGSYAAGNSYYNFGQHLDLRDTDKGANPQFRELDTNLDI